MLSVEVCKNENLSTVKLTKFIQPYLLVCSKK